MIRYKSLLGCSYTDEVVAALVDFVANCPVSLESVETAVPELGHIFEDGSGNLVISGGEPVSFQPEEWYIELPDGTLIS